MSEQVHIRVGETRHEKWVNHAEAEYDGNMSKLIRNAVENEISNTSNGNAAADGSQTVEANGRIDDILTGVEDNGSSLEAIEDRLKDIQDTMLTEGGVTPTSTSAVYGATPLVEKGLEDADKETIANKFGATPEEIAEDAGVSVAMAVRTLQKNYEEYDSIGKYRGLDDEPSRYWRVEP